MESRTKNVGRNIIAGTICKIINLFFPFINRTILIKLLGTEYVGLGSLFTSILTVLNTAELGFNAAIIFSMYEPIARQNHEKVKELLALYKFVYRIIGFVITIAGLIVCPFVHYTISGDIPGDINIYLLFGLFLMNTVMSYYMFSYKESILLAYQREDLSNWTRMGVSILVYVIQTFSLLIFHSYYLYVVISIFGTILTNVMLAIVANKNYPEYKQKSSKRANFTQKMKKQIGALLLNRICAVTINSLDSIIISCFLGLTMVTVYNNYFFIFTALYSFILVVGHALTASIGNSLVTENKKKNFEDLKNFSFLNSWISGCLCVCLVCTYQPFMRIWVGEKLMLSNLDMLLFCVYFYIICMNNIKNQYITASGTQEHYKKGYVVELVLNLVLNILLGKILGVTGILLATIITTFFVDFIYMVIILFRTYFVDFCAKEYICLNLKWTLEVVFISMVAYFICDLISINGIVQFFVCGLFGFCLSNIFFCVIWRNTIGFGYAKGVIKKLIGK